MRVLAICAAMLLAACATQTGGTDGGTPAFRVDTSWPQQPLPNNWLFGDVANVAVDRHNHIWVIHRPGTLSAPDINDGVSVTKCCLPAPPVIEFDADGNVLRSWGGHVEDWFESEHGIFVDATDNVWVLGAGNQDGQLLKFDADGHLLLRIGRKGAFAAADDPSMLARPTDIFVDTERREVFVSDGYHNKRVIVFDSETGAFKRQWTAFGRPVGALSGYVTMTTKGADALDRFTVVHCITMIGEEVFVCDRTNSRIQVFTPEGAYLREFFVNREFGGTAGTTWDAAPVPGHPDRLYVLDGVNSEIVEVDHRTGAVIRALMSKGRYAGQMHWPHQLAVDQQGRLYITEVATGMRLQRFIPQ